MHHESMRGLMPLPQVKTKAQEVAAQMNGAAASGTASGTTGGGSAQRGLPEDVRQRFVEVRSALIERGIFDPVLIRFDTATAPQATTAEIAQQLTAVADSL